VNTECVCHQIHPGKAFTSSRDYKHTLLAIKDLSMVEIPVQEYIDDAEFPEFWFQCPKCNQVWRLVDQNPPFPGTWSMVEAN
jgi:hypothetical protein